MIKFKYSDRLIDVSLLVISLLGIVMIGSASVDETGAQNGMLAIKNMLKQILFVFGSIIVLLITKRFFKTRLLNRRILKLSYIFIVLLMLLCLLFENEHGGRSWIPIFGLFSIQPAEFAKILVMGILAYYMVDVAHGMQISPSLSKEKKELYKKQKKINCLYIPAILCLSLLFICVALQKDFGTGIILLGIMLVCFFSANDRYYKIYQRRLFAVLLIGALVILLAFPLILKLFDGYQQGRFVSWLDPLSDPLNTSYQQVNGLIAFAQNGIFGRGLGNSTQKFGYIPEAYNDYITAIIFEELGIFGLALIIIPYTLIIWRLFHYAYRISDNKAKIMLCGIASYFFLHLFLNLGGVSGLIPMTGIPLLCVSMGGSSTLTAYLAIGIAQAIIWRYNKEQQTRL